MPRPGPRSDRSAWPGKPLWLDRQSAAVLIAIAIAPVAVAAARSDTAQAPAAQNPSPMVERSRPHGRIPQQAPPGVARRVAGPAGKPVEFFVPSRARRAASPDLVIHFHGAAFVPQAAVSRLGGDAAVAVVNVGSGGGVYDRTFTEAGVFAALVSSLNREAAEVAQRPVAFRRIILSGFSAGYGAVRAILRDSAQFDRVDAVLLLDGLHASYVPENTVLAAGGAVDERALDVFVRFGRAAMDGKKRFLVTHSEIFPGTFASTTETTDLLIEKLGLRRVPVLRWGPNGMQQLSEARKGRLAILGFAGNTAPDHIDHFHGMPDFLRRLGQL